MSDQILDVEWDDVVPGMIFRWVTPSFVRRGKILAIKGPSIKAQIDGQIGTTVIPDARWYFDMISKGNAIVIIADPTSKASQITSGITNTQSDYVTPSEAAMILGTDSKTIRRRLRSGSLPAIKQGGSWLIHLSDLGAK